MGVTTVLLMCHGATVTIYMIRYLILGSGLRTIFLLSELQVILTLPLLSGTSPGQGISNAYVQAGYMDIWLQMVASSCFQWVR